MGFCSTACKHTALIAMSALATVAAAWLATAVSPPADATSLTTDRHDRWLGPVPPGWGEPSAISTGRSIGVAESLLSCSDSGHGQRQQFVTRAGWPFLAFQTEMTEDRLSGSLELLAIPESARQSKWRFALPVRPLWDGLAANLIFFYSVAVIPFVFRALLRRARSSGRRCTSCGYQLLAQSIRCPECGVSTRAQN
jgi:hypothetical protein